MNNHTLWSLRLGFSGKQAKTMKQLGLSTFLERSFKAPLTNLDDGDLKHETDFGAVYASLLQNKMNFDPTKIGIKNNPLGNLF